MSRDGLGSEVSPLLAPLLKIAILRSLDYFLHFLARPGQHGSEGLQMEVNEGEEGQGGEAHPDMGIPLSAYSCSATDGAPGILVSLQAG